MPAYNFQRRFAPLIRRGFKRSTIRLRRKDGRYPKPGDNLYLFTGMRTKQCKRLKKVRCKAVRSIEINNCGNVWPIAQIKINGRLLTNHDLLKLWLCEGFDSLSDMLNWFRSTHGVNFSGLLIEW